jgi:hypothetical protein
MFRSTQRCRDIEYDFGGSYQSVEDMRRPMTISGDMIGEVENFKNLISFAQASALAWMNNIELSAVG